MRLDKIDPIKYWADRFNIKNIIIDRKAFAKIVKEINYIDFKISNTITQIKNLKNRIELLKKVIIELKRFRKNDNQEIKKIRSDQKEAELSLEKLGKILSDLKLQRKIFLDKAKII